MIESVLPVLLLVAAKLVLVIGGASRTITDVT